jgi:hypothetical protein
MQTVDRWHNLRNSLKKKENMVETK